MYEAYAISKHFYMQKPIERMNPTGKFSTSLPTFVEQNVTFFLT